MLSSRSRLARRTAWIDDVAAGRAGDADVAGEVVQLQRPAVTDRDGAVDGFGFLLRRERGLRGREGQDKSGSGQYSHSAGLDGEARPRVHRGSSQPAFS